MSLKIYFNEFRQAMITGCLMQNYFCPTKHEEKKFENSVRFVKILGEMASGRAKNSVRFHLIVRDMACTNV